MTDRRTRRLLGAVLAIGLSAAGLFGVAPEAKAAGLQVLPSFTTISATANPAPADLPITLTSQVNVLTKALHLGPVTPNGTVTFSKVDYHYDPETDATSEVLTTLATAPVSSCTILLSKCTATSAPIVLGDHVGDLGTMTVRATYSGDLLSKPSSAEMTWSVAGTNPCNADVGCSETVVSGDDTARGDVLVLPEGFDPTPSNLTVYFDTIPLSCSTPGTGANLVVDIAGGGEKLITFTTYGAEATKANQNPNRICYLSNSPFAGATFDSGAGGYVGLLPVCVVDVTAPPCVVSSEYTPQQGPGCDCDPRARLETVIFAPAGDPKSTR
jgi:hypothetical protein